MGYALLPLGGGSVDHGGHKGFGLALFSELLCGPLAGARWSRHAYQDGEAGVGHFMFCLNLEALGDPAVLRAGVEQLAREVRGATAVDPDRPVRLPGDRRHEVTQFHRSQGIPVLEAVLDDLDEIAELVDVRPISRPLEGR
jgi:L-2-hydroxycarboxylate dehydrogenase (NAD+)